MIISPFPRMLKALPPVMTDRISGPTQENTKVIGKFLSKDFKNHKVKFVLPLSLHNLSTYGIILFFGSRQKWPLIDPY